MLGLEIVHIVLLLVVVLVVVVMAVVVVGGVEVVHNLLVVSTWLGLWLWVLLSELHLNYRARVVINWTRRMVEGGLLVP